MNPIWKQYIGSLSKTLLAESEKADMFKHKGIKGEARESFVSAFLSQFLPESMGVSTGEIFDRQGRKSPQMDVIVYDKSTPTMQIGGASRLFPIDAVVAAIEVKTELNSTQLNDALRKFGILCSMGVRTNLRVMKPADKSEPQKVTPTEQDWDWIYPGTYVFGYSGYKTNARAMPESVAKWLTSNASNISQLASQRLAIPRVVATPTTFLMRQTDDLILTGGKGGGKNNLIFLRRAYRTKVLPFLSPIFLRRYSPGVSTYA